MSIKEIVQILVKRDGISENEAYIVVQECIDELRYAVDNFATYDECTMIVQDYLGLEPDYLEVLL